MSEKMKWYDTSRIEAGYGCVVFAGLLFLPGFLLFQQPLIFLVLTTVGLLAWFIVTAPERAARKELIEQEARDRAEELARENQRMALLLKQEKDNEYAKRRQLRSEIERMPKYTNWRSSVFDRHGKRCEMCGSTNDLEIHHRTSFDAILRSYQINTIERAFECDALWDVGNGSVLCKPCHEKMESSRYREIMQGHEV